MSVISFTTLFALCLVTASEAEQSPADAADQAPVAASQPLPHHWITSYSEAVRLAALHKKPLLLHFDAPWCGACRRMEEAVLHQPSVTALLGDKVIGVRLNADYNKDLIAEFGISSLPTEVVVLADGTRGSRYTGATSLSSYVARLNQVSGINSQAIARADAKAQLASEVKNLRSCLIVKRDGKMVGLGGFSPVALKTNRQWVAGSDKFVANHEGVCYFLTSAEEVAAFQAAPATFIPRLHGCDLVELSEANLAKPGAIEYGSFFEGGMFFFSSLENRSRFEKNPRWFMAAATGASAENEDGFPFLKMPTANQ